MFIENWDRDYLGDQQNVIGRAKVSGAPLTGGRRVRHPGLRRRRTTEGQPVIPADAHIRLASPEENDGTRILRRGYSYTDGIDPVRGTLLGGLFFIAFMKNPAQFIKLQRKLGVARRPQRVHPAHRAAASSPSRAGWRRPVGTGGTASSP